MGFIKKLFGFAPKIDWDEVKQSLEPKVSGLKKPAIRLVKSSIESRSKFGGRPLVELKNFKWPESNGKPMAFLAQIDLSEISEQLKYDWLDNKGLILFFYDMLDMPWGFDPKDRGKWKVIYQCNPDAVADYPDSIDKVSIVKEFFVSAKLIEILPSYDDPSVEALKLSDKEADLYCDLNGEKFENESFHQVGGFPSPIQANDMELESQLASNGIYAADSKWHESDDVKKMEEGAKEWRLLFQFDTDDELDIMWGDCGMLYFWVQQEKSRKNQFDNTWLILQCC